MIHCTETDVNIVEKLPIKGILKKSNAKNKDKHVTFGIKNPKDNKIYYGKKITIDLENNIKEEKFVNEVDNNVTKFNKIPLKKRRKTLLQPPQNNHERPNTTISNNGTTQAENSSTTPASIKNAKQTTSSNNVKEAAKYCPVLLALCPDDRNDNVSINEDLNWEKRQIR